MKTINYSVQVVDPSGNTDYPFVDCTERQAAKHAAQEARKGHGQVFVIWFRASDGQRGYLNSDGSHAITGKVW